MKIGAASSSGSHSSCSSPVPPKGSRKLGHGGSRTDATQSQIANSLVKHNLTQVRGEAAPLPGRISSSTGSVSRSSSRWGAASSRDTSTVFSREAGNDTKSYVARGQARPAPVNPQSTLGSTPRGSRSVVSIPDSSKSQARSSSIQSSVLSREVGNDTKSYVARSQARPSRVNAAAEMWVDLTFDLNTFEKFTNKFRTCSVDSLLDWRTRKQTGKHPSWRLSAMEGELLDRFQNNSLLNGEYQREVILKKMKHPAYAKNPDLATLHQAIASMRDSFGTIFKARLATTVLPSDKMTSGHGYVIAGFNLIVFGFIDVLSAMTGDKTDRTQCASGAIKIVSGLVLFVTPFVEAAHYAMKDKKQTRS